MQDFQVFKLCILKKHKFQHCISAKINITSSLGFASQNIIALPKTQNKSVSPIHRATSHYCDMEVFGVRKFFSGKSVLVTGGTGFVGKAVIEKILRSCPEVENIYVLIRPKRDILDVNLRLENLLQSSIFETLKKNDGNILKKIRVLCGDVCQPNLGLSEEDQQILTTNVSIIIHSAATTKFNESLSTALNINVNGLKNVLEICKKIRGLKAFVHVSTAYSNCNRFLIEEKVYPAPPGTSTILDSFKSPDNFKGNLDSFSWTGKGHPNTYTYSKAVAEQLMLLEGSWFPTCIVRPSIVTAAWKEPVPGWIDSVSSPPTGMMLGTGYGVFRVVHSDPQKVINIIPVDVVANAILCAAWETSCRSNLNLQSFKQPTVPVYTSCATSKNIFRIGEFTYGYDTFRQIAPFSNAVMYPDVSFSTNKVAYIIKDTLLQLLPALVCSVTKSDGGAMRAYWKVREAIKSFRYFGLNEWTFSTNNLIALHTRLPVDEKRIFYLSTDNINWKDYIESYCFGIRKYILKEDDASIQKARRRMIKLQRFYFAQQVFWMCLCGIVVFVVGCLLHKLAFA